MEVNFKFLNERLKLCFQLLQPLFYLFLISLGFSVNFLERTTEIKLLYKYLAYKIEFLNHLCPVSQIISPTKVFFTLNLLVFLKLSIHLFYFLSQRTLIFFLHFIFKCGNHSYNALKNIKSCLVFKYSH